MCACDGACRGHCVDIQGKNAGIGGDIALVGGDAAIAAAVIDAVGRLTEAQQAGMLLEGRSIEHGQARADGAARGLVAVGLLADNEEAVTEELSLLCGYTQLSLGVDHRIDVILHLVVVVVVVID